MSNSSVVIDQLKLCEPNISKTKHVCSMMIIKMIIRANEGCECYWDSSNTECACCNPGACQCGPDYPARCVECGGAWADCVADKPATTSTTATVTTTPGPTVPPRTCGNKILLPLYVWPSNVEESCNNAAYVKAAQGGDKVVSSSVLQF